MAIERGTVPGKAGPSATPGLGRRTVEARRAPAAHREMTTLRAFVSAARPNVS